MKILALLLMGLTLTSCGPPVLQVPIGQAALVYADAKTAYTVLALRLTDLCKAGKLGPADCAELDKQGTVAKMLDGDIRAGILAAQGQIDWDKVMQLLQVLAGLAVKLGGL